MDSNKFIFQNLIDFEYNKFKMLGFLQRVQADYEEKKLFPALNDLKHQYNELIQIKENIEKMLDLFPKELKGLDLKNQAFLYEKPSFSEDKSLQDIQLTISFAIPKLQNFLITGKNMHDALKENLHLELIGIEPPYIKEGYLLLYQQPSHNTHIFQYSLSVIQNLEEDFVDFKTAYVKSYTNSLTCTFDTIKSDLVKQYSSEFPIPAAYLVESKTQMPLYETFLPIARELLIEYVYSTS